MQFGWSRNILLHQIKALAFIARTFQKRAASSLLSSRGAVLPTAAETPAANGDDFDLVTWLVILSPGTNGSRAFP